MSELRLRKATAEDSGFAYQTKKAAFRGYVEQVGGWNEEEQRELHEQRFRSQEFYVLHVSGIDVGIVSLVRESNCIKLNQLFILPEYQSRGYGRAYMSGLIDEAAAGSLALRLRVLKVNRRAVTFYQRLGFTITGESDTHILMEKSP